MNLNETVNRLLTGQAENHLMPFFWQHGEDEKILRKYVGVIQDANCNAFCVESRPEPGSWPSACSPGIWVRTVSISI